MFTTNNLFNDPYTISIQEKKPKFSVDVDVNVEVNESYAKAKIIQSFTNTTEDPLELMAYIYKSKENFFESFEAEIGEKKVKSKVIEKQKGLEKYTDAIAVDNTAIYVEEDNNGNLNLKLGNLHPKSTLKLITNFLSFTKNNSENYFYELLRNFPMLSDHKKRNMFRLKEIKVNVHIKCQNEIKEFSYDKFIFEEEDILEVKESKYLTEDKKEYSFKYTLKELPSIDDSVLFSSGTQGINEYFPHYVLKFKSENKGILFKQKNPKTNDSVLLLNTNFSEMVPKNNLKLSPALFIFLIDQSGSMSGRSINTVKEVLKLFLPSLPKGSFYQLIGFGSTYNKYNNTPVKLSSEEVNKSLEIINKIKADLGGTDIYEPLKEIYCYSEYAYKDIPLPKNIILLTDGEINDRTKTLNLIENNSKDFYVYSIGIGSSFDKNLIENAGRVGRGGFNFVKEVKNLDEIVIKQIEKCVENFNVGLKIDLDLNEDKVLFATEIPTILRQNESFNYFRISSEEEKPTEIKIKFENITEEGKSENISEELKGEEILCELPEGEELSKLAIHTFIRDQNEKIKGREIEISKKYQVVTEGTCLFAEVEIEEEGRGKDMKTYSNKEEERPRVERPFYRRPYDPYDPYGDYDFGVMHHRERDRGNYNRSFFGRNPRFDDKEGMMA
ncbi:MAG: VIT and VWA domain-containing protein, partial [archaeon]|nr:VIT and VWA domain-containing protein [archaeon]